MENKILVTGANGLLGTALRKILGGEHVYHTRKDADLTNYDQAFRYVRDRVNQDGVDTIIHTAARVGGVKANMENNELFFYENYYINNNILRIAYELKIETFVNVLSTCIFPNENITYPLTPDQIDKGAPHFTNYGYSYAKRLSGYETKIFKNVTGRNWYSVVPTNLYGPNDNFNLESSHLIPGLIHRAYLAKKNGEKFVVWGNGTQLRQFIYSEDLAKLLVWTLSNWKKDEHCMLINEEEISVSRIVDIIKTKLDLADDQIVYDTTKPEGQFRKPALSDVSRFPFRKIEDGVNDTIDWFINNFETCRK